jgi:hypothetical protein
MTLRPRAWISSLRHGISRARRFRSPSTCSLWTNGGRPDTYGTSAREDKTLMTLACEASNVLLPEFYIGILAEMFDILFDQLSQLPRLANLDPVVHRPEEAVALGLKRAALGINELKDQHR